MSATARPHPPQGVPESGRRSGWLPYVLVAAATLLSFEPVLHCEFVEFDDQLYVTGNAQVQQGLSLHGLRWAFVNTHALNWQPLTWLSHMLDVELFGLAPAGHHAMNALLHLGAALFLLRFLERATGSLWTTAAALLFAVHPLRVESVAWVAERKDVLCALFWMASLIAYLRWTERPTHARSLVLLGASFAALAAKPMAVTLPFTLLLLDVWPLARLEQVAQLGVRIREKLPLFALALVGAALTLYAQSSGLRPQEWSSIDFGLVMRLENAIASYAGYLWQLAIPRDLIVVYPYRAPGVYELVAATLVLLLLSTACALAWRRWPYLGVGWLWYLGTLVPVIGLVQVGFQASADRYTYVPSVGICIALAFGAADAIRVLRLPRWLPIAATTLAVLVLGSVTRAQIEHWRDTRSLFEHALAVDEQNAIVHVYLANTLRNARDGDGARRHLERALEILPDYPIAHFNLAVELEASEPDAAIRHYELALESHPDFGLAHYNLANLLFDRALLDRATEHYTRAIELLPGHAGSRFNLGLVYLQREQPAEADRLFRAAGRYPPGYGPPSRAGARP